MKSTGEQNSKPKRAADESTSSDLESLSGTRGEALFEQLIADIDVMYKHARHVGKPLSDALVGDISKLLAKASATKNQGPRE